MSRTITCPVTGVPSDTPTLVVDLGQGTFLADLSQPGVAVFTLPSSVPSPFGGWVSYAGDKQARFYIPPDHTTSRSSDPCNVPGLAAPIMDPSTLEYYPALARPVVDASPYTHRFVLAGQPWLWKGLTAFRLLEHVVRGRDIVPTLRQYRAAGATLVRFLCMKANNTGWQLLPSEVTPAILDAFFALLKDESLYGQGTVLADTRTLGLTQNAQLEAWHTFTDRAQYVQHIFPDLCNEWNHPTQAVNPNAFPRPGAGLLASHGSGLTDAHPVEPFWGWAPYHSRREPFDARVFGNYDCFEFEADYPKRCPMIPEETIKPSGYSYRPAFAEQLGRHASRGAGGTFHWDGGIDARPFEAREEPCARAFFDGVAQ